MRLCRRYGVTRAGYYAWRRRPVSEHAEQDRNLSERILAIFHAHQGRYGSPRIHRALHDTGWQVSRRRVARLMREARLRARLSAAIEPRPARIGSTISNRTGSLG